MREGTRLGVAKAARSPPCTLPFLGRRFFKEASFSIFVFVLSFLKRCLFTCAVTACISVAAFAGVDSSIGCPDGTVISSISYEGLEHTKARVVERELLNKAGEPFSAEKFDLEKRRLQDLDLFTDVSVECNGGNLKYTFVEIFRWIPAPAGKTTERDGLMIGLALANLNVLGEDIRAEVQYRTSSERFLDNNEYAFYASSPYLFGLPLGWNFEFLRTDSYDDIRDYHDDSWLVDLDLDYQLLPHLSILGTIAYRDLKKAVFTFDESPAKLREYGLGFAFDFRDTKIDTRKGIYYEYMLTHVKQLDRIAICGGSCYTEGEDYWELLNDARAYYPVGRFVMGATALVRYRPGEVYRFDYFSHGGVNSYRGRYGDSKRLGVHETLLNLEERFILLDRQPASIAGVNFFYGVQLVAGLDGSLIWNSGRPGWDDYEGAVYGGIHLVVPAVDRLRFEVGYSPDRGEPKYFFGMIEKVSTSRWRGR